MEGNPVFLLAVEKASARLDWHNLIVRYKLRQLHILLFALWSSELILRVRGDIQQAT